MDSILFKKRILVVEDDYYIARELGSVLAGAGALTVGPVGGLSDGLSLVETEEIDAALLDVNLNNIPSYPIVDQLTARGVPCMLITGYDTWSLPEGYRGMPQLLKPFEPQSVLRRLRIFFSPTGANE